MKVTQEQLCALREAESILHNIAVDQKDDVVEVISNDLYDLLETAEVEL